MSDLVSEQPEGQSKEVYSGAGSQALLRHVASRSADKHAAFFLPYLRPDMELLDCGCGLGKITLGLAQAVTPGRAVGIDIDANQIKTAERYAAEQNVSNVHFESASIYDLPFADNSFDAVFSHAVLTHLADPAAALREIYRVLKTGGVVGIRNPDFAGYLLSSTDPVLRDFWKMIGALMEHNSGSPYIGRHQRALLQQARFANVQASATFDCYATQEATQHWGGYWSDLLREEKMITQLVGYGLATRLELESMSNAWKEWGESPGAFHGSAFGEVVGWKE
jgi:ubiquinone/menaquinone biosynthesis C-methylase UbiE